MPDAPQPRRGIALSRALRRRCPVCGEKGISAHPAHVDVRCPVCGLFLERQVGSFIGGIALNTIVTFGALFVVVIGGFLWTRGDGSVLQLLVPAVAVSVLLPVLLYARSRLLWVALELIWWPLEPDETSIVR